MEEKDLKNEASTMNINWDLVTNADKIRRTRSEQEIKDLAGPYCNNIIHPSRLMMFEGKLVPIDEPIADLVSTMNRKGFKTLACCCGHIGPEETDGQYYFMLENSKKNQKLLNIINKFCMKDPESETAKHYASAGFIDLDKMSKAFEVSDCIRKFVKTYLYSTSNGNLGVYFFWEDENAIKYINSVISRAISEAETLTVGELIDALQDVPRDTMVFYFDNCMEHTAASGVEYLKNQNKIFIQ